MSDTKTKIRTITLTDRPPVRIKEENWPRIASAHLHNSRSGIESDASRNWYLNLRQHADGRRILYGKHTTHWQGERYLFGGELLSPGDDVASVARRVSETIGYEEPDLARELLADMPAEDLE